MRKALKVGTLLVIALLPVIIVPQFYDPLGVRLWDDVHQLFGALKCIDARCMTYRLSAGALSFPSGWTVTTDNAGRRATPDNALNCALHIALIGDSLTWAPNVSDAETWANRLAQQFPLVCFHNYAQWGYNAEQVALVLEEQIPTSVDYVIYFLFQNDDMLPFKLEGAAGVPPPWLYSLRYIQLIAWRLGFYKSTGWGEEGPRDPQAFEVAIRKIAQNPKVRVVGFEQEFLVHQVRGMGIRVFGIELPAANEHVSALDQHPNAAGHSRIARALIPFVESLLAF